MTQEIYGYHIVHIETGIGYAFCSAADLTEEEIMEDLDPNVFTLVPLVIAGEKQ